MDLSSRGEKTPDPTPSFQNLYPMSPTSSQGLQELISAGAKDIEVSHIAGNLLDDAKRRSVSAFTYFVSTADKSYGASVGQRLKPLEMNVWKEGSAAAYGETVFEITVDKGTI